ncbi:hypothetical protein [Actinokineospora iranica]|uniref:hypothetical protein n=1 Tax=Actinokineospora iranica TaxID=1271860 RepID=UPI001113983C|nr:hypothetical protein [Actinokineospora iranica]
MPHPNVVRRFPRARVERGTYLDERSLAVAEVLDDRPSTWTTVTADALADWWHDTPPPMPRDRRRRRPRSPDRAAAAPRRAATILATQPITRTLSPHAHAAIGALLATVYAFDGEPAPPRRVPLGAEPSSRRAGSVPGSGHGEHSPLPPRARPGAAVA